MEKALEEGIRFAEGLTPLAVEVDSYGHARALQGFGAAARAMTASGRRAGEAELPAQTILIAAGTQPNTVLAREDAANFKLDGEYFQACDENGEPVKPEKAISKPASACAAVAARRTGAS